MNFKNLIEQRESVRAYTDQPVERDQLLSCVEAARLSPSACNRQPWKYIIVDDPKIVSLISKTTYDKLVRFNRFTKQAQAFAVIVLEPSNGTAKIGEIKSKIPYSYIDIGCSVMSFCYQATELGLGTCILGWFNEKKIKKLLNIPKRKKICLLVSIGYPKNKTRKKSRKKSEEMMCINQYD